MFDFPPVSAKSGSIFYSIGAVLRGLRRDRKGATAALTLFSAAALIRLTGLATDIASLDLTVSNMRDAEEESAIRLPPRATATGVALEASSRGSCVMVLGKRGKLTVGSVDSNRDTTVKLASCDLYNGSGDAESTELIGEANLSARDIFLSGGYTLSAGTIMAASRFLATYANPVPEPYAGLAIPTYSGCTRTGYKLRSKKADTIAPGVYCGGINVEGGSALHLDPGTYILDRTSGNGGS